MELRQISSITLFSSKSKSKKLIDIFRLTEINFPFSIRLRELI